MVAKVAIKYKNENENKKDETEKAS